MRHPIKLGIVHVRMVTTLRIPFGNVLAMNPRRHLHHAPWYCCAWKRVPMASSTNHWVCEIIMHGWSLTSKPASLMLPWSHSKVNVFP